jgi:hypothetical protein
MAAINDLILIHIDNKPGFYARVEDISPDVKPGWWQVKLLALSFPLQIFTWILDGNQIDGSPFTMGGTPVRMDRVVAPVEEKRDDNSAAARKPAAVKDEKTGAKVVSLAERKNKK